MVAVINNLTLNDKNREKSNNKDLNCPLNKNKVIKDSDIGKSKSQRITKAKITNEKLQTYIQKEVEKQLENRVAQNVMAKLPVTINKQLIKQYILYSAIKVKIKLIIA